MNPLEKTLIERLELKRTDEWFPGCLCLSSDSWTALNDRRTEFLHPEEETFFLSLAYERRQSSYILGRYCAKQALSDYFGEVDPRRISIQPGVFNQPVVHYPDGHAHISISHSGDWGAAIAYPEAHPMAIDIEEINADRDRAIRSQLTEDELSMLPDLNLPTPSGLTLLW
ncbi:MAG: 4'-phosphopantetheinyl transferase, partial [Verrucomicrobiota bacterium]